MIHAMPDATTPPAPHVGGITGWRLYFRQFGALARKNLLTQRRAPFQLVIELLVPAAFIFLLGYIKSKTTTTTYDGGLPLYDTPVPTYEALETFAVHPNVFCYDNSLFFRCGCHVDGVYESYRYLSGRTITDTVEAMWATGHPGDILYDMCSTVLYPTPASLFNASDQCTIAKFATAMCDDSYGTPTAYDDLTSGYSLSDSSSTAELSVAAACGDGESVLNLNATEYIDLIGEMTTILDELDEYERVIPEADIGSVCQALVFAVMPKDSSNGVEEATAFLSHVRNTYPSSADHWQAVDSEGDFLGMIDDPDYGEVGADIAFSFGIVFSAGSPDWEYKIRTNGTKEGQDDGSYSMGNVPSTFSHTDKLCKEPGGCTEGDNPWTSMYHQSAVLAVQQLVDNWIISQSMSGDSFSPPVVRLAEFPHAEYESNGFWGQTAFAFAIMVVIAVMYPVSNVISSLVKEKELRVKEGLKMMGLTGFAHTSSWAFHFFCLFFFTTLLMILASGSLFENSDPVLIFLFLLFFFMATTAFCFFISAFFSRARTASTIGTLAFFVALFPYFSVSTDGTSADRRRAACLLPPTCLALGTIPLAEFEDAGLGVTGETAGSSEDGFTFNDVMFMLIVDILVYSALAWYAGNVLPSEWGTTRKPWFIFTKSYWLSGRTNREAMVTNAELLKHDESEGHTAVEGVSDELKAQVPAGQCVAIRGLSKVFKGSVGGSKLAVDKLDLTMYSGQITALLGHNGAGKTTTIAMLTGMIPATSGSAFVAGRDVRGDMSNIRHSLGVCPQHDILYPNLTVREHLRMYAVLKGVPDDGLRNAVKTILLDVGLTEKENELTKTLSGGQKRKLSVGIALIGGSKVVFLDEPTSGMDPHSRRFTWDLIRKNREGRVVVLTTHFMDEADLLGDRVAIMADGKLKCCGSSLFLKKHYGVGYNLTIVRNIGGRGGNNLPLPTAGADVSSVAKLEEGEQKKEAQSNTTEEQRVKLIKALVRSHVKAASVLSNVGAEVSFQLPNDASSCFKDMLLEMDHRQDELGINSYGVSVTTLEEVFIKVATKAADHEGRDELNGQGVGILRGNSHSSTVHADKVDEAVSTTQKGDNSNGHPNNRSKAALFGSHVVALLKKRMLTFGRDKKMWAFVVFMPVLFITFGILILLAIGFTDSPALTLTPEKYNGGGAPLPFAAECTVAEGVCDPAGLMEWLDAPDSAQSVSLDVADDSEPGDAVGKLNVALSETSNSYDETVYGALSFRQADTTTATFDYTIHSNYSALHSIPVYLNQMNSAMLRFVSGDDTLSITTVMHPFPLTEDIDDIVDAIETYFIVIFTILAFSFTSAGWIMYIVKEKDTKCKYQQVVSGVGLEAYWLSSFGWDFVSFFIPASFTIIVYIVAGVDRLLEDGTVVAVILLFLLYGLSMIPYTYLGSFLFSSHNRAQNLWLFHNFALGILGPMVVLFMPTEDARNVALGILRLFPHFSFSYALLWLSLNALEDTFEDDDGAEDAESSSFVFKMDATGESLVYMAVETVVYLVLLLLLERLSAGGSCLSRLFSKLSVGRSLTNLTPQQLGEGEAVDEDVTREEQRIDDGGGDGDAIRVNHVSKVYSSSFGAKVAVKNTSLGIPKGECFGLLGINGAGKSSILSILTGEIPATTGSAFLGGHDVGKDPEAIHRLLGYCPQFDALFEKLTGREHLRLYAVIKGMSPRSKVEEAVNEMIDEMGLAHYADKLAGGYSGGNKRRLSVAIAMIGDPQIVFLDEPSTGMDPLARRLMWNFIMRVVTQNRACAMILTTHSMEECEALCQVIGIMVGGRMRCLGSSQHLKTRFGKGLQLEARVGAIPTENIDAMLATIAPATGSQAYLASDVLGPALDAVGCPQFAPEISAVGRGAMVFHALVNEGTVPARDFAAWLCLERRCDQVIAFIQSNFEGTRLREKQNAKMRFDIPQQEDRTLGSMFGFLEDNATELGIGEYALSQTSLEQIFNGFAAQQEEEQGRAAGIM